MILFLVLLLSLVAWAAPAEEFLTLPPGPRPVEVQVAFHLFELNDINDTAETFQFTGLYTLTWKDPRQAFEGTQEKLYSGNFQVDEVSPAWYPQLELINGADLMDHRGTILRVRPDGTCSLTETLAASAETPLYMRRYPFDRQSLRANFQVLGFDSSQVRLVAAPATHSENLRMSQWKFRDFHVEVQDLKAPYAGGTSSTFVMTADVQRWPLYAMRLVVFPMGMIVMATWVVFWMDRTAVGDRINVSFVGILTVVAYQIVTAGIMPQVAYITLMNAFINLCFTATLATVAANLLVGHYATTGQGEKAERIERIFRWLFPGTFVATGLIFTFLAHVLF